MVFDVDEQLAIVKYNVEVVRSQRNDEAKKHDLLVKAYVARIQGIEKMLVSGFCNARVHNYIDAMSKDNGQSPYVIQRQAILCSILHHIHCSDYQMTLIMRQHEEELETMIDSALKIDDDFAENAVNIVLVIADALDTIRVKATLRLRKRLCKYLQVSEGYHSNDTPLYASTLSQQQEQLEKAVQQDVAAIHPRVLNKFDPAQKLVHHKHVRFAAIGA